MTRVFSIVLSALIAFSALSIGAAAETSPVIAMAEQSGYEKNQNSAAASGKVTYNELNSYDEYLSANADVQDGKEHIVIGAANLVKKTSGVSVENGSSYPAQNGENYKEVVYTGEDDEVTFKFSLKEAGKYNIIVNYHTVASKDINIVRELMINGVTPFSNAAECNFVRSFVDSLVKNDDGTEGFKTDYLGNQLRPEQKEVLTWKSSYVVDYLGYNDGPLNFFFKKGVNTISLNGVKEPMVIGSIEIVPLEEIVDYDTYIKQYQNAEKYDGEECFIEAEHALVKSDKTLYPSVDVSTASTSSGDRETSAYKQSVNMLGGTNWEYMQQSVTWSVGDDIKEGLYSLNFKYRQNVNDGMRSPRKLYINGKVPFVEANTLEFGYTRDWMIYSPQKQDGSTCLVYLKPGDTITLECTLSQMGKFLNMTNDALTEINEIYRKIIKITGTDPDTNRDYQLDELIPEDIEKLGKCADDLQSIVDGITEYTGESSSGLSSLNTLIRQMTDMYEDCDTIGKELSYFKSNIGSLGTWLNTASYVPLEIDYISLSAPDAEIKDAEAGFFKNMLYGINRFISSFVVDYNAIGNDSEIDANDDNTITVWMAGGRDQFQVLRQLINSSYTAETGNKVNLELVNMGALLSAVVAGIGPDVAIDQAPTEPVNYALRNAVYDLKNFKDDKGTQGSAWDVSYDEVLGRFLPEAMTPFYFDRKGDGKEEDTGLYALPEKQSYNVMFYRSDILAAEGIEIPKTWDELISTITALNKKNLEFGMPTSTIYVNGGTNTMVINGGTNIFYAMLVQKGGNLYTDDRKSTALQTDTAIKAFKQWTNFYVNYDLPLTYDFKNRFRTGEMPLGIDDYTMYNTLAVSAPEINGRWGYTLIPGTKSTDENGKEYIDHSTALTVNCSLILKDCINYDLSWKFLKWWSSTDTQASFGNQIESILGPSARYNTANLEAFGKLPWTAEESKMLNEQLSWGNAIPQIAGSYFIDRHINNAFRKVKYQEKDAKDTLYDYANTIDAEITKKRSEFGLPIVEEE